MEALEEQHIITDIRRYFEKQLEMVLNVTRVTAPLFVKTGNGINDNLNGVETPVIFNIKSINTQCEIVHSLAKWKRMALAKYNVNPGEGIYTNMNAIRADEELDELHSAYVDQWDWEKVITAENRNIEYLKWTVQNIYYAIKSTIKYISSKYGIGEWSLPDAISFVTAEELLQMYPDKTPKEREYAYIFDNKSHYATFIIGIGGKLSDGKKHDGRSPDYDDWSLNGDIILADIGNDRVLEISSMGIRVDKDTLVKQLDEEGVSQRLNFDFHKKLMNDELPLSIGGGIGQSRLCQYILHKKHIKDVQESVWE